MCGSEFVPFINKNLILFVHCTIQLHRSEQKLHKIRFKKLRTLIPKTSRYVKLVHFHILFNKSPILLVMIYFAVL